MGPGAVGEGAEVQPLRAAAGVRPADQPVAVQQLDEELFQTDEALRLVGPVEAEARPGFRGAFDDTGAVVRAEPVGVAPDPAVRCLHEGERESVEDLRGAQPDVLVPAEPDLRTEAVGVPLAHPAVDTVAGDDQVGVGQSVTVGDLVLVLDVYAQGPGALGEEVQQLPAADAESLVAVVRRRTVTDVRDPVAPADRVLLDDARRLRIPLVQFVEETPPVRHPPSVGRTGRVPFMDRDVVVRVLKLHQDREVQTGGPTADAGDLHTHTPLFAQGDQSTAQSRGWPRACRRPAPRVGPARRW